MKRFLSIISLVIILLCSSCMYNLDGDDGDKPLPPNYKLYSGSFMSMGTVINLQLYSNNQTKANQAFNDVKRVYTRYDLVADDGYDIITGNVNKETELAILNEERVLTDASPELIELLEFSLEMQADTNGYFNPFMGKLNHMWKRYINGVGSKPSDGEIIELLIPAQKASLEIDYDTNTVKIIDNYPSDKYNQAVIDLGGVAKGYATYQAELLLREKGYEYFLINAGSSNISMGTKPNGSNYNVGIGYVFGYPNADPKIEIIDGEVYIDGTNTKKKANSVDDVHVYETINDLPLNEITENGIYFILEDAKVYSAYKHEGKYFLDSTTAFTFVLKNVQGTNFNICTSSPSEQNRDEVVHHIISPKTGRPENYHDLVSIIGPDSGKLDAYSTAIYSMPLAEAISFIESHNIDGIVSYHSQIQYQTEGMSKYEV